MTSLTQNQNAKENKSGRLGLFAAVVALVLIAAYAVWQVAAADPVANTPDVGGQPETPRAVWAAQEIDSYRFDLTIGCFCIREMTRPVTIEVVDGQVSSITYIDDGTAADPLFFEGFATIDQLFERLAEKEAQNPVLFDVTYDQELGIPLDAEIDVSEQMADEELWLTVRNFEAIQ
jgi:hypothetical protein